MATIEKSIEVDVPVRMAYNQWTQFEEFPRFMEGVKSVRQLDDTHLPTMDRNGPPCQGSRGGGTRAAHADGGDGRIPSPPPAGCF